MVVHRGLNFCAEVMNDKLYKVEYQQGSIPTKTLRGVDCKGHSHRHLHKRMKHLLFNKNYGTSHNRFVFLVKVEVGFDLCQKYKQ